MIQTLLEPLIARGFSTVVLDISPESIFNELAAMASKGHQPFFSLEAQNLVDDF